MNLKYRPDIDGLRALAVLSVIVFHLNHSWLHGGFVGVDIFFVISGFLITKIIYSDILNKQFSFKVFYQRRINRILPVFFVVMFCSSFVAWYVLLPDEFMLFLKSLKSTTYFWENMFFAQNTGGYWDQSAETMPILHTWSLAVEEQFYILFPFGLLLLMGVRYQTKSKLLQFNTKTILAILCLVAFASFLLAQISPKYGLLTKYNYYSLFTGRAGELLIGSIIGILSVQREKALSTKKPFNGNNKTTLHRYNLLTILGFIGIVFSFVYISEKNLFPSFWALIPTVSAAFILYFYHSKTWVAKFLSLKPIVFIGKISYSLYLWHWPVIVLARKYLFVEQFTSTKQYIIVAITTLILSLLTYYLIETPARKKKRSFKFSLIAYYLIPSLLIIGIFVIQKKTEILEYWRYGERLQLYKLQIKNSESINKRCFNKLENSCIWGDQSKKPNIVLFGDSHSAHYAPYLDEIGKSLHFSFNSLGCSSCIFLESDIENLELYQIQQYEIMLPNVEKAINESDIIIYAIRSDIKNIKNITSDLPRKIKKLVSRGKTVIIFSQTPTINQVENERFLKSYLLNRAFSSHKFLSHKEEINNNIIEKIALKEGAIFINPLSGLSASSLNTWPIYNGLTSYRDETHLNEYVTRQWAQEVLPKQKEFWEQIAKAANEQDVK